MFCDGYTFFKKLTVHISLDIKPLSIEAVRPTK